jgi:hypothetical protein
MFWHHDVGLSFPKSVGALIGGSADLFVGVLFGQEVFLQREIIADEIQQQAFILLAFIGHHFMQNAKREKQELILLMLHSKHMKFTHYSDHYLNFLLFQPLGLITHHLK